MPKLTLPSIFTHPALKHWEVNEVRLTKDIAKALNVTTATAYRYLTAEEKAGTVSCYGYRVPSGWEDRKHHGGRTKQSLGWQRNEVVAPPTEPTPATHFGRLIDEANAAGAFTDSVVSDMAASMSLDPGEVRELIDEATSAFEEWKDAHRAAE